VRASEAWPVATERSRRPRLGLCPLRTRECAWVHHTRDSADPNVRLRPARWTVRYLLWVGGSGRTDWQINVRRTLEFMLAPGPGHPRFWMSRVSSG